MPRPIASTEITVIVSQAATLWQTLVTLIGKHVLQSASQVGRFDDKTIRDKMDELVPTYIRLIFALEDEDDARTRVEKLIKATRVHIGNVVKALDLAVPSPRRKVPRGTARVRMKKPDSRPVVSLDEREALYQRTRHDELLEMEAEAKEFMTAIADIKSAVGHPWLIGAALSAADALLAELAESELALTAANEYDLSLQKAIVISRIDNAQTLVAWELHPRKIVPRGVPMSRRHRGR